MQNNDFDDAADDDDDYKGSGGSGGKDDDNHTHTKCKKFELFICEKKPEPLLAARFSFFFLANSLCRECVCCCSTFVHIHVSRNAYAHVDTFWADFFRHKKSTHRIAYNGIANHCNSNIPDMLNRKEKTILFAYILISFDVVFVRISLFCALFLLLNCRAALFFETSILSQPYTNSRIHSSHLQ